MAASDVRTIQFFSTTLKFNLSELWLYTGNCLFLKQI